MEIKSLGDIQGFFGGLKELKTVFQKFDQSENPKKALEEVIGFTKRNPVLDNLLKVSKTRNMISRAEKRAEKKDWNYACEEVVKEIGVNYEVRGAENIPANGKALYISNHPYGLLDGVLLFKGLNPFLTKIRRKLKIIASNQLQIIKGIEDVVYFVHSTVKKLNLSSVRQSLRYVNNGGDLAIYPSGGMSKEGLKESLWKNSLGTFISYSSRVVPMWLSGPDHGKIYNFLAKNKRTEKLKGIFSLREMWNKAGEKIVLNIGKSVESEELKEIGDTKEKVQYLRQVAEDLKVAV